jgi:ssDNA-binding Zn-finger/Zn-ribbon topoisomerase 1
MEYRKSRQVLKQVMLGIKVTPYEKKEATFSIRHNRALVPCPRCKVAKILRYQSDRGYCCVRCSING